MIKQYSGLELALAALFDRLSVGMSTEPLEEQPYYHRIRRLVNMAENGLHPRAWVQELLKELGLGG